MILKPHVAKKHHYQPNILKTGSKYLCYDSEGPILCVIRDKQLCIYVCAWRYSKLQAVQIPPSGIQRLH